jgi:hypothetical protein
VSILLGDDGQADCDAEEAPQHIWIQLDVQVQRRSFLLIESVLGEAARSARILIQSPPA